MRLLHTADWHLGRSFHGSSLLGAQAAWIDWLVELAREREVDAIVVSGDIYDRALPPVDAIALADDALSRLVEIAPVVAISGNHDSAGRLAFGSSLFERAGVHLRTDPARVAEPVMIGETAFYAIPYLEPDLVRTGFGVSERGHGPVLGAAMDAIRADLATRPAGTSSVVLAHAFVAGGAESASERDLSVGGVAHVPASVFSGVDYVALGHLHGPQRVGDNARYAGSPIAFSFSEQSHTKSVVVVDVAAGRQAGAHDDAGQQSLPDLEPATRHELIPCPVDRPLARISGPLDVLLADPALTSAEGAWVEATITDPVRPLEAMDHLRVRFPYAVVLRHEPAGAAAAAEGTYADRVRGLDDRALAARFVEDVRGQGPTDEEQSLLDDALADRRLVESLA